MSDINIIFKQSFLAEAAYAAFESAKQPDGSYRKEKEAKKRGQVLQSRIEVFTWRF